MNIFMKRVQKSVRDNGGIETTKNAVNVNFHGWVNSQ